VAVMDRDHFGLSLDDYNNRVQCYKRLTTLWDNDHIARSCPGYEQGRVWNQTNTVLVDDSTEKARSQPYNLVQIPEFRGRENENDAILPQVHDFLNSLTQQADVSAYLRVNPFRIEKGFRLSSN
jgi:hypothetical protein